MFGSKAFLILFTIVQCGSLADSKRRCCSTFNRYGTKPNLHPLVNNSSKHNFAARIAAGSARLNSSGTVLSIQSCFNAVRVINGSMSNFRQIVRTISINSRILPSVAGINGAYQSSPQLSLAGFSPCNGVGLSGLRQYAMAKQLHLECRALSESFSSVLSVAVLALRTGYQAVKK